MSGLSNSDFAAMLRGGGGGHSGKKSSGGVGLGSGGYGVKNSGGEKRRFALSEVAAMDRANLRDSSKPHRTQHSSSNKGRGYAEEEEEDRTSSAYRDRARERRVEESRKQVPGDLPPGMSKPQVRNDSIYGDSDEEDTRNPVKGLDLSLLAKTRSETSAEEATAALLAKQQAELDERRQHEDSISAERWRRKCIDQTPTVSALGATLKRVFLDHFHIGNPHKAAFEIMLTPAESISNETQSASQDESTDAFGKRKTVAPTTAYTTLSIGSGAAAAATAAAALSAHAVSGFKSVNNAASTSSTTLSRTAAALQCTAFQLKLSSATEIENQSDDIPLTITRSRREALYAEGTTVCPMPPHLMEMIKPLTDSRGKFLSEKAKKKAAAVAAISSMTASTKLRDTEVVNKSVPPKSDGFSIYDDDDLDEDITNKKSVMETLYGTSLPSKTISSDTSVKGIFSTKNESYTPRESAADRLAAVRSLVESQAAEKLASKMSLLNKDGEYISEIDVTGNENESEIDLLRMRRKVNESKPTQSSIVNNRDVFATTADRVVNASESQHPVGDRFGSSSVGYDVYPMNGDYETFDSDEDDETPMKRGRLGSFRK